jgi:hypothetical protein
MTTSFLFLQDLLDLIQMQTAGCRIPTHTIRDLGDCNILLQTTVAMVVFILRCLLFNKLHKHCKGLHLLTLLGQEMGWQWVVCRVLMLKESNPTMDKVIGRWRSEEMDLHRKRGANFRSFQCLSIKQQEMTLRCMG